tara:strand:- start:515 stop:1378 length:864 start_codon:yes stop_codon:yes gene_type:complete
MVNLKNMNNIIEYIDTNYYNNSEILNLKLCNKYINNIDNLKYNIINKLRKKILNLSYYKNEDDKFINFVGVIHTDKGEENWNYYTINEKYFWKSESIMDILYEKTITNELGYDYEITKCEIIKIENIKEEKNGINHIKKTINNINAYENFNKQLNWNYNQYTTTYELANQIRNNIEYENYFLFDDNIDIGAKTENLIIIEINLTSDVVGPPNTPNAVIENNTDEYAYEFEYIHLISEPIFNNSVDYNNYMRNNQHLYNNEGEYKKQYQNGDIPIIMRKTNTIPKGKS